MITTAGKLIIFDAEQPPVIESHGELIVLIEPEALKELSKSPKEQPS